MKKLILSILFILCLSFQASAWNPFVVVSGGGISDYCSSCTPGDPTDEFCEDAEGSNTIETGATDFTTAQCSGWTPTIDTGAYLYEQGHSGSLSCSNKGSYAIQYQVIDVDNNDSEDASLSIDTTDSDLLYVNFYFNVISSAMSDDSERVGLATIAAYDAGNEKLVSVAIDYQTDPLLRIAMSNRNGAAGSTDTYGTTTIVPGTWYRGTLIWNRGTAASFLLNGSVETTNADIDDLTSKGVTIGSTNATTQVANHSVVIQMDMVGIDLTADPGVCE